MHLRPYAGVPGPARNARQTGSKGGRMGGAIEHVLPADHIRAIGMNAFCYFEQRSGNSRALLREICGKMPLAATLYPVKTCALFNEKRRIAKDWSGALSGRQGL